MSFIKDFFNKISTFLAEIQDRPFDMPERYQMEWVCEFIPEHDREELKDELRQIRCVRNPIDLLLTRRDKIFKILTQMDIVEVRKKRIFVTGPGIHKEDFLSIAHCRAVNE